MFELNNLSAIYSQGCSSRKRSECKRVCGQCNVHKHPLYQVQYKSHGHGKCSCSTGLPSTKTAIHTIRSLSDLAGGETSEPNEVAVFSGLASQNVVTVVIQFIKSL